MLRRIKQLFIGAILLGLLCAFLGAVALLYIDANLPKIETLADYHPPVPSTILSKDGRPLATLARESRQVVSIEDIPTHITEAFLAAEDDKFYEHMGVDVPGVLRALWVNLKAGRVVQGGSTITQQVAKSFLLSSRRSLLRKIKDFLLAIKIEKKFSKEEILHLYLNQIYLGGGYYGVKAAFDGSFQKGLHETTVAEAAMVAGLLVAPGRYSPYINPEFAQKRQRYVLGRLLATGKISRSSYEKAIKEEIRYYIKRPTAFRAGYFTDWVVQRATDFLGKENFLTGGFTIKTTLDMGLQKEAEKQVLEGIYKMDKRQGFRGPIGAINLTPKREHGFSQKHLEYIVDFRKDLYFHKSQFFTIGPHGEKNYELTLDVEEIENIRAQREKKSYFFPGLVSNDPLLEFIKEGDIREGLVLKTLDREKIAFVDVGGLVGALPQREFAWAHPRMISEHPQWFAPVQRPSQILSPGDKIHVRILKKSVPLVGYLSKKTVKNNPKAVERISSERYLLLRLEQIPQAQGAMVAIGPQNGHVLAMVGGTDFGKSQFNRAVQSQRQPGSALKPLIYAVCLENGHGPNSIIIDSPETLASDAHDLNWKPRNYDGKFLGPITFRNALEKSRNIPTIKLTQDLGVEKVIDFFERIGLEAEFNHDLSLALGPFGVTPLNLVATYAMFPSGGRKVSPTSITEIRNRHGQLLEFEETPQALGPPGPGRISAIPNPFAKIFGPSSPEPDESPFQQGLDEVQVYDRRLAYIMTNLLRGVIQNGTGQKARALAPFVGGKTGTTSNYVDAWFIGFSSHLVAGVWTGFDHNKTLGYGETGARAALPIWKGLMEYVLDKWGQHDFNVPPGLINAYIDKDTGKVGPGGNFLESFVGTMIDDSTPKHGPQESDPILKADEDYFNNL